MSSYLSHIIEGAAFSAIMFMIAISPALLGG